MAAENILKSIYSYIDVLATASSPNVQHWDAQALQHAIQWAEYCEKLYSQAQGKRYEKTLDEQIKHLANLPSAVTFPNIDLAFLKDAKGHLQKALLQNIHLPQLVFENLLKSYGDVATAPELLVQHCYTICSTKASAHLSCNLLDELKSGSTSHSETQIATPTNDICYNAQAELLLIHIVRNLRLKNDTSSMKKQIEDIFHNLIKDKVGVNVLMRALLVNPEGMSLQEIQTAQNLILDWLDTQKEKEIISIWKLPPDQLGRLSSMHFRFFQRYIQFLVSKLNNVISWDSSSYHAITEHFRHLCDSNTTEVSKATKVTVKSLCYSQTNHIWIHLAKDLNITSEEV